MLEDLVLKNRSYRRFYQDVTIELETLRELVDLARLSPSAANRQALKFIPSNDPEKNALVFPNLLIDYDPIEGERPTAYVIVLYDNKSCSPRFSPHPFRTNSRCSFFKCLFYKVVPVQLASPDCDKKVAFLDCPRVRGKPRKRRIRLYVN